LAREQRRLAAIVAADVVGYSRLMGRDESGTLARLREHRTQRFEPTLARHGGRLVKLTGDGALVEFASAVDALGAAIEFQQSMAEVNRDQPTDTAIVFRIGLHLGDLIVEGEDLFGDGVNVAARLEAEALPGGIVISYSVRDAVAGRLKAMFEDLGNLVLKNIERPVQAFAVKWEPADWKVADLKPCVVATPPTADALLTLPDKPSIAVLPFQNMSGDPEQEYFADGLVEDIITALSRFKSLFVIARNSSFTYKGKAVDIKQVGRELGVRYVLEGSVRKAGNRLRITSQLIEAATDAHLWADRFDGSLEDVFELQDSVTLGIVGVLDHSIISSEIAQAFRKSTSNLGATDYYYRALAALRRYTAESVDEAEALFAKAAATDPGFAAAYGLATWCHIGRKSRGWPRDAAEAISETRRLANLAWAADRDDAYAIGIAGYALVYVVRDLETGKAWLDRSISINPNIAGVLAFAGQVSVFLGLYEEAIEYAQRAIRLNPRDPGITMMRTVIAHSHYYSRRFGEAARWALMEFGETPDNAVALRIGAASLAMSGAVAQAAKLIARLDHVDPTLRISTLSERLGPYGSPEAGELYIEGLRLAGLPE